jgi:phage portal protein BeeE
MVMSEWEGTEWAGSEPQTRAVDYADGSLAYFADRLGFYGSGTRAWHLPTIRDALGVPAIARSVTLVAFTGGSLTPQAFRDGRLVETPRVIVRPDPFQTPRDFYRDVYWNMATYGETVLWIAHRDGQGYPDALINVPATELMVEDNPRNRLFPIYRWGQLEGSRWSPVNPRGQFVHITYAKYPGALRGVGPLQLCQAAVSVAVEAQEWAANFYGDGGHPSVLIKHAGELSPERKNAETYLPDPDGSTEADLLRAQWVDKPNNVPRVIDQRIESVDYVQPNPQGAQMLDARNYQNGDAARAFGIPGELLEYAAGGSSLTYKNLADVWINFVRGCLAPNYLEPVEQALSDLLPRATVVRMRTEGLYRGDAETRWRIYQTMAAVLGADRAAEIAEANEELGPGNPETVPVPYAPPSVTVSRLPEVRSEPERIELRCDGMHARRHGGGDAVLSRCNALLSDTGVFVGRCRRCKKDWPAAA